MPSPIFSQRPTAPPEVGAIAIPIDIARRQAPFSGLSERMRANDRTQLLTLSLVAVALILQWSFLIHVAR